MDAAAIRVVSATGRRARRRFIELPYRLMRDDPWWCPPLRSEARKRLDPVRNPFFLHADVQLLLACSGHRNRVVGRLAAFVDANYDRAQGGRDLLFGWFDCEQSPEAASALFRELERIAGQRGRDRLVGPLTFSINEEAGMLVSGFDSPHQVMTPHNPPWYPSLLEGCGFGKLQDLFAYRWRTQDRLPAGLERAAARCEQAPDVVLTQLDLRDFRRQTEALFQIYNDAFQTTWGHVPLTREEFSATAADLRQVGDPRLTLIARVGGEPAAFGLALPDWNQALRKARGRLWPVGLLRILRARRSISAARFIILAVRQRYRNRGLEAFIIRRMLENSARLGYPQGELSMVLESNLPMRLIIERRLGASVCRRYRIYQKPLPVAAP